MRRIIFVLVAALLLLSLVITGCSKAEPEEAGTIIIGEPHIFSGPIADQMSYSLQGVTLVRDFINANGGITVNGKKYEIELYQVDSKFDAVAAAAATTECISRGIKFILGDNPSFLTLAITSVTEPNGAMCVVPFNGGKPNEFQPETSKYKFYANMGTLESDAAVFQYLNENHPEIKDIAYIIIDDGAIAGSDANVRKVAEKYGLNILGETIGYAMDTVDYTPIAQKAMARNPEAVFISNGFGMASGNILKGLRTMGYDKPVFSNAVNQIEYILDVAGEQASSNYFQPDLNVNTPDMPAITKQLAEYTKANWPDQTLDMVRLMYGNSLYVMVKAIEKAQSLDPAVVAAEWEKWDELETLYGMAKTGGLETYGIKHSLYHPVPIMIVENGEPVDGGWVSAEDIYLP